VTTGSITELSTADLESVLRIRAFESKLLELFTAGQLSGTTHTCLGQEYIPVALAPLLQPGDFVFSNHRGHGHYLARFRDPEGLLAEILGREGAVCQGVGGSQHVYRRHAHLSTGVQGESVPVATGVAFHFKRSGGSQLAIVHIGDGTWGEGAVYEGLNLAALWKLPLVLVVENNGIAQSTPTMLQMAGTIEGRVRAFGIAYDRVTTSDIHTIREQVAGQLALARERRSPLVLDFETVRLGPHSKGDDTRSGEELEQIRERDLVGRYAASFPEQYALACTRADEEMAAIVSEVLGRPPATWSQT
jgi:pyruvate dehydrogenase E1 component alpha subunit